MNNWLAQDLYILYCDKVAFSDKIDNPAGTQHGKYLGTLNANNSIAISQLSRLSTKTASS